MDSDFSHDPTMLPVLLRELRAADVVVGSRYVAHGSTPDWSLSRRIISRGGSIYARAILSVPVRDLTSGFKCFRRSALEALDLDAIQSNGYAFQVEVSYRCYRQGLRLREVPITFVDRRVGQSKMSGRIVLEAVWLVWWLRFRQPIRRSAGQPVDPAATPVTAGVAPTTTVPTVQEVLSA
jgi:dolichol-phosphate mannosyltransferase